MSTAITNVKALERRKLHFSSLEDILADVDRLAQSKEIKAVGNWTPGQIFKHLALVMNNSIDGFEYYFPAPMRFVVGLFFKRKFLSSPMPSGFKLPKKASQLLPPPTSLEEGLQNIRRALHRLQTESNRVPSPFMGKMSREDWNQLHCRHSELHLSFLIPVA